MLFLFILEIPILGFKIKSKMKKPYILAILILFGIKINAQNFSQDHEGFRSHYRFSVGFGGHYTGVNKRNFFNLPVVDQNTGFVKLENKNLFMTDIGLGMTYSFMKYKSLYTDIDIDAKGKKTVVSKPYYYYAGLSAALFYNPIGLSFDEGNFSNNPNIGFGLGYIFHGGAGIFAVVDFKQIVQPTESFIEEYGNGETQYKKEGDVQYALDYDDNSIVSKKLFSGIGFKITIPISVAKSFKNSTASDRIKKNDESTSENSTTSDKGKE